MNHTPSLPSGRPTSSRPSAGRDALEGPPPAGRLVDDGLVALVDAVADVQAQTRDGARVLSVRMAGGFSLDVLPDRGLDLGAAWWRDVPVAWRSPNLVDPGPGYGWEERFLGGLLATCGPDNIGEPRGASGQHGTHHLSHAHDVSWWRTRRGDEIEVHVRGLIGHTSLGGSRVVVEREIVLVTGAPVVRVEDVVRNVGDRPTAVPLLYHVNLGAPLLAPGSRLQVDDSGAPVTREPLPPGRAPGVLPEPDRGLEPVVAEHRVVPGPDGRGRATVVGGSLAGGGVTIEVTWPLDTLPRLSSWAWPARGAWVLGVEPSNAPLFGPERAGEHAGAPVLAPGAHLRTGVQIALRQEESR